MAMVLTVMLCMGAFSMTALAVNDEGSEGAETETPAESSEPLTPDGNLTLVDDTESGDKEFITVQTKAGNTFYLIIDHASDEENVYFLNLVDEEDFTGSDRRRGFSFRITSPARITPQTILPK